MSKHHEMDSLMARFIAGFKQPQSVVERARPQLVAVTPTNASQFTQAPKKRGCPAKVRIGGNVVAFPRPAPAIRSLGPNRTALEEQQRKVALLLDERRVRAGLPPAGIEVVMAVVRSAQQSAGLSCDE